MNGRQPHLTDRVSRCSQGRVALSYIDLRGTWSMDLPGPFDAFNAYIPYVAFDDMTAELGCRRIIGFNSVLHDAVWLSFAASRAQCFCVVAPVTSLVRLLGETGESGSNPSSTDAARLAPSRKSRLCSSIRKGPDQSGKVALGLPAATCMAIVVSARTIASGGST